MSLWYELVILLRVWLSIVARECADTEKSWRHDKNVTRAGCSAQAQLQCLVPGCSEQRGERERAISWILLASSLLSSQSPACLTCWTGCRASSAPCHDTPQVWSLHTPSPPCPAASPCPPSSPVNTEWRSMPICKEGRLISFCEPYHGMCANHTA